MFHYDSFLKECASLIWARSTPSMAGQSRIAKAVLMMLTLFTFFFFCEFEASQNLARDTLHDNAACSMAPVVEPLSVRVLLCVSIRFIRGSVEDPNRYSMFIHGRMAFRRIPKNLRLLRNVGFVGREPTTVDGENLIQGFPLHASPRSRAFKTTTSQLFTA